MKNVLGTYEGASGQRLNNEKTSVFFSRNTSLEAKERILSILGVPDSQCFDTYLGLPALIGKSRTREFQSLVERVKRRVSDWKTKFLSQAGKEVLIKAVVQAIPTYSMSIFLLPTELCKELNRVMQNFWWSHKENDKKIHWMSWEKLGRAKDQGGLGFRDIVCFNKALLAKQCWRLMQYPESLAAKIIKAKYFFNGSFMSANLGNRPSYAWRSIMAGRELFEKGIMWRIGNGKSVWVRGDKWIPTPVSFTTQSASPNIGAEAMVADLLELDSMHWNRSFIEQNFSENEAVVICNIPLNRYNQADKLIWRVTKSGEFSVKNAYHLEKEKMERRKGECSKGIKPQSVWKRIWGLNIPNSAKMFIWRACKNILPTKDNLKKRKVLTDDICNFCCNEVESVLHILWECPSS
jgi:hypothetical protein